MIVILNNTTHVGANPPSDTTKTWISADMAEISIYPEPETYGRLNERINVKAILLAHNLDIKSDRIRVFSLADDVLEVKKYIDGEWVVIDNPSNFVNIVMNGKVIGTMEVDTIAPGEQVEEWDGSGVVIKEIASISLISFTIDGTKYQAKDGMTWKDWCESEYNTAGFYVFGDVNVMLGNNKTVVGDFAMAVSATDEIIADKAYSTTYGSGN